MYVFMLSMLMTALGDAGGLVSYESQYYVLQTDVSPERAKWIGRVMDAAGKEYDRRFQGFRGVVRRKSKRKVFKERPGFTAEIAKIAGGTMAGSTRGVFVPGQETVYSFDGDDGRLEAVLKHECFHQFAHFVIGGRLPAWADEGLAEYFAEGVFEEKTGHLRLGTVPQWRVKVLHEAQKNGALLSIEQLLRLSQAEWNDQIDTRGSVQYSQAWALCHFLVHADGGRYEPFFTAYLRHIDQGLDAETAFARAFGTGTKDLQEKYEAYIKQFKR